MTPEKKAKKIIDRIKQQKAEARTHGEIWYGMGLLVVEYVFQFITDDEALREWEKIQEIFHKGYIDSAPTQK